MKKHRQGFTLVEIMIVVMIIGLLAAIALPGFKKARSQTREHACINNMRQIESAKDQYALELGTPSGGTVVGYEVYLKQNNTPLCPVGNTPYTIGPVGTPPTCNAGVGHALP